MERLLQAGWQLNPLCVIREDCNSAIYITALPDPAVCGLFHYVTVWCSSHLRHHQQEKGCERNAKERLNCFDGCGLWWSVLGWLRQWMMELNLIRLRIGTAIRRMMG